MLARALANSPNQGAFKSAPYSGLLPLRVASACFPQLRGNESLFTFADGFWSASVVIVQQICAARAFTRTFEL
jgi:hypothetical protein